ncbi:MAG: Holliday junction resolvase RuvX [Myxococcales bacterium]|nr:Holliday junction resolvase RuvX [Myxococcales bacterium]MDH5308043.1 Holliday junction resolvase RuvX [Myxococcales bacterium]MDH5567018.1 Holliday junction resolvase RuvX [Myxococcales bacterium]
MTGPVLGLDLGTRRIGLAVSDLAGSIAFPAGHLARRDLAHDLEALRALAAERGISRIVVGLPLHLDGRSGEAAQAARTFARALEAAIGLPVDLFDERWTSVEAERALRGAPRRRRARRKDVLDAMAATLMLRTYLETRRAPVAPEEET